MQELTLPFVDYTAHPAFAGAIHSENDSDTTLYNDIFARIDTVFEAVSSDATYRNATEIEQYFVQNIDPYIAELKQHTSLATKDCLFADAAVDAFLRLRNELLNHAVFNNRKKRYHSKASLDTTAKNVVRDLQEEGISLYSFDANDIATVFHQTKEYQTQLKDRAAQNPKKQQGLPLPKTGAYWSMVENMLAATGIAEGISEFNRCTMDMQHCALYYSQPAEEWYKDGYADVGLATPRTATMHYDHDFNSTKILFYLKEVTENDGPFSVVKGSNRWKKSYTQFSYFKQLDQTLARTVATLNAVPTDFYRPIIKFPQYRAEFMKLPKPLQGSSHFGDDILDDTELSKFLLQNELKITTAVANCSIFTGHSAIHRGGMVGKSGERWAFQIIFTPRDESFKGFVQRAKTSLKRMIA